MGSWLGDLGLLNLGGFPSLDGDSDLGGIGCVHCNGAQGLGPDCVFGFLRKSFVGNRHGRCWKEPTSGRKGVPRLNLRKGPRLGVTTEMEGPTGELHQA